MAFVRSLTRFLFCIAFMLPSLLRSQTAMAQQDCVLKKANGDLKVFSCPVENEKMNFIKVEMILENTTPDELLDFVRDVENYTNWQYHTIEAVILKVSDSSIIYRTVVEAPWPVSNREMVTEIKSRYDSSEKNLQVVTRSTNYAYPGSEELVRVPFSMGVWNVSVQGNSTLRIDYTLKIDPGGSVPAWLLNMAIAEGPFQSFSNLKTKLSGK